jgi:hypothetical protein
VALAGAQRHRAVLGAVGFDIVGAGFGGVVFILLK